jgi:hypothetical protein
LSIGSTTQLPDQSASSNTRSRRAFSCLRWPQPEDQHNEHRQYRDLRRSQPPSNFPRHGPPRPALNLPSAASETRTITRSRRRSSAFTRPRLSGSAARGGTSTPSSPRRSGGSTGSTIDACSSRLAMCDWPRRKTSIIEIKSRPCGLTHNSESPAFPGRFRAVRDLGFLVFCPRGGPR